MKVLEIISAGYAGGGAENGIIKINHYLTKKGYRIKTLASDLEADKPHFNEFVFKSVPTGPSKLLFYLFNPSSFFALKRLLRECKPDIVHLHTMNQVTPSVLFLLKKYPTVMTLHGPETFLRELSLWCVKPSYLKDELYELNDLNVVGKLTYFYFNSIQKAFYKVGLKNVDVFIAPSRYIQNLARADVSPIIHLPNFIELRKFHESTHNFHLLFVGRLEKLKGIEFLIQAMAAIINVFPQAILTIIGDGSYKTNLLNLTRRLQLEKHIHFTGWVENKDLDAYYEKASILVIPSLVEAFGGVILEAMSAGRPVIGTKVGGIPEIIDDGVNGYMVEPENPDQIAEKIIHLFGNEQILKEFGKNARKTAEEYRIENYVEKMEKVYQEILSGAFAKYEPHSARFVSLF